MSSKYILLVCSFAQPSPSNDSSLLVAYTYALITLRYIPQISDNTILGECYRRYGSR